MKTERYTAEQVISSLHEAKGMITLAARRLDCHPDTVRSYVRRYPTVADALREEREGFLDIAELALMRAVQGGESWAVAFALKTIGRDRGYVETTRNLNLNLTPADIEKLDDAELDDTYKRLIDAHSR